MCLDPAVGVDKDTFGTRSGFARNYTYLMVCEGEMSVLKRLPVPVKRAMAKCFWPLMPSWVDEGRRIVQGPVLKRLIERAARQCHFRRVLNAGSGESGFAFLLAGLPGVEQLLETDIDVGSGRARVAANQI